MTNDVVSNAYILHDKLGEGGMGVVYRATHRLTGRQVALKRMRSGEGGGTKRSLGRVPPGEQLATDPPSDSTDQALSSLSSSDERFSLAQEFQTLATLRHPNIVSVLSYGFDQQQQPYYTMELLTAPVTISDAGVGCSVRAKAELLVQLLQAIAYLHRRGILHRDIKPSNVLVVDSQVKLVDFGIADVIGASPRLAGTPEYLAPEIMLGYPASVASDLYALGIVAFELFTGNFPEQSDATVSPEAAELFGSFFAPSAGGELDEEDTRLLEAELAELQDSSQPVIAILRRLIAPAPEARYQDALHVIRDLGHALGQDFLVETEETRESFLQAAEFVGRTAELKQMLEALQRARSGHGAILLISGESGVGKSRLLQELRTRAMVQSVRVVKGQAATERAASYQLWTPILRELSLETELDEQDLGILRDAAPDLEALLGRQGQTPPPAAPQAAQARLTDAIIRFFKRQRTPALVILEDLHWAGTESLGLIARLSEAVQSLPILIVGNYRNDEASAALRELPGTKIQLERLDKKASARLVRSMLGKGGKNPALVDYLYGQTEGNIFFLVEVLRVLAQRAGQLDLVAEHALPADLLTGGIEQLVDRRLGQLSAAARALLELAAVAGRQLDLKVLTRACAGPDLSGWLTDCMNAMVLETPQGELQFAHDKIRERLLKQLDPSRRRLLHLQIADAIQVEYGDDKTQAPALAHHYDKAGAPEKALAYYLTAAKEAARLYAVVDARAHYAGALGALAGLPATAERRRQQVDTLVSLVSISLWAEPAEQLVAKLTEAESLLLALKAGGDFTPADQARLANVYFFLGRSTSTLCAYDRAISYFRKASEAAAQCGDDGLRVVSLGSMARCLQLQGNFGACWGLMKESLDWLSAQEYRNEWARNEWARVNGSMGMSLVVQGRVKEGMERMQETLRRSQDPTYVTRHIYMVICHLFLQDWTAMREHAQQCAVACEQTKDELMLCCAVWMLSWAESWLGFHEESALNRERAHEIFSRRRNVPMSDLCIVGDADAALHSGAAPEKAIALAQKAVTSSRAIGGIYGQGLAHRTWARALAALDEPDWTEVEAHLDQSIAILQSGECWLPVAQTRVLAGELASTCGKREKALEHFERAAATFAAAELRADFEKVWSQVVALRSGGSEAIGVDRSRLPMLPSRLG